MSNTPEKQTDRSMASYILIFAGMMATANVLLLGIIYLFYPGYIDTGEPNIVALAWRLLDGHPVYLPLDDPIRTTNVYGPHLYLVHAALFSVTGASVLLGKLPGIMALFVAMLFVGLTHRRFGMPAMALGLGFVGVIVALNLPMTIWDRPETFLLMCVAVAVYLHNLGDDAFSCRCRVIGYGLLIGFAMGLKVFAAIYFLPLGLVMLYRDGIVACIGTVIIAVTMAAWPFLLSAFDLGHMMALVDLLSGKPNSLEALIKILRYALYYIVPAALFVVLGWNKLSPDKRKSTVVLGGGLLTAIALVLYPAQKPGAGLYYLVPFAPIAAHLVVRGYFVADRMRDVWIATGMIAVLAILSVPTEKRFLRALDWDTASSVAAEIQSIAAAFPTESIEIGIGDNNDSYRKTFQRTRLVFEGHPYSLDTSIVIETTAWGIELKPGTIALISNCATDIWLIPAGERPFDWIGFYGNDIYGPAFRAAFAEAFERIEQRKFFDVYACRT